MRQIRENSAISNVAGLIILLGFSVLIFSLVLTAVNFSGGVDNGDSTTVNFAEDGNEVRITPQNYKSPVAVYRNDKKVDEISSHTDTVIVPIDKTKDDITIKQERDSSNSKILQQYSAIYSPTTTKYDLVVKSGQESNTKTVEDGSGSSVSTESSKSFVIKGNMDPKNANIEYTNERILKETTQIPLIQGPGIDTSGMKSVSELGLPDNSDEVYVSSKIGGASDTLPSEDIKIGYSILSESNKEIYNSYGNGINLNDLISNNCIGFGGNCYSGSTLDITNARNKYGTYEERLRSLGRGESVSGCVIERRDRGRDSRQEDRRRDGGRGGDGGTVCTYSLQNFYDDLSSPSANEDVLVSSVGYDLSSVGETVSSSEKYFVGATDKKYLDTLKSENVKHYFVGEDHNVKIGSKDISGKSDITASTKSTLDNMNPTKTHTEDIDLTTGDSSINVGNDVSNYKLEFTERWKTESVEVDLPGDNKRNIDMSNLNPGETKEITIELDEGDDVSKVFDYQGAAPEEIVVKDMEGNVVTTISDF